MPWAVTRRAWRCGRRARTPRLILDAGMGIRSVTGLLDGNAFHGTILLSHLHWDHVQGLPFFSGADRDDAAVRLLLPDSGLDAAAELLVGEEQEVLAPAHARSLVHRLPRRCTAPIYVSLVDIPGAGC